MSYPDFNQIIAGNTSGGKALLTTQRSLRSLIPQFIIFGFLAYGALLVNLAGMGADPHPFFSFIPARLLGLIPFIYLLNIVRKYYDDLYLLSNDKVTRQQGRLWFTYKQPTIKYADIRGIIVQQSFWGRIFNYGDILIGTAAQDQNEITLVAVGEPYQLAEIVERFRARIKDNLSPAERRQHID